MTSLACWKCDKAISFEERDSIPFRAVCDHCGTDIHCCCGCRYYHPGLPNDCEVPGTDPIVYRDRFNFCEEFRIKKEKKEKRSSSVEDIEKRLFGEEQ